MRQASSRKMRGGGADLFPHSGPQIKGAWSVCGAHRKWAEAFVLWNAAEGDAAPAPARDYNLNLPPLISAERPSRGGAADGEAEDGGWRGGKHEGKTASSHLPMATIFGSSSQWGSR